MSGKVYLVGAGPGDPELLTLKALRVLGTADVVLHDDLVAPEIVGLAPPTAWVRSVGKRHGRTTITQAAINELLLRCARAGRTVVRLKGGDPLVFGRAGEEIQALREGGVDFEIVPGVTAATAAAAAARISLTDRRAASAVVALSGHRCAANPPADWQAVVALGATIVLYMPGDDHGELARTLQRAGLSGQTPCLIVSRVSTAEERLHRTGLAELSVAPRLPAPALLIVGSVAASHDTAPTRVIAQAEPLLASAASSGSAARDPR